MFVGDVGSLGLHQMFDDVLTSSLASGSARSISVILKNDGSICFKDDDVCEFSASPDVWLTSPPFADSSAGRPGQSDHAGKIWAFAVVNALSERFQIDALVKENVVRQEFHAGVPSGPSALMKASSQPGIVVTFKPDAQIFSEEAFSKPLLQIRLEELAFLHTGTCVSIEEESTDQTTQFRFDDGIQAYVEKLNRKRVPLHEIALIRGEESGIGFEVGIQFCEEREEFIRSYVNDRYCRDQGTHVTGIRIGLTRAIKKSARPKYSALKWSTRDNGLTAVISVRMDEPQFIGACRSRLQNSEVQSFLANKVGREMTRYFSANADGLDAIVRSRKA